jgi:hypothetical protein
VIHLLYAHRIWIVGRNRSRIFRIIPCIVIVLTSGVTITLYWATYYIQPSPRIFISSWAVYMSFSVVTFLDILITSSLWYLLASSRTGFSHTDGLIKKLIYYTIDCGCLTSICTLSSIIMCAVTPNNVVFLSIQFLVATLYVNSYIALLNTGYYIQSNRNTISSFGLRREPQRDSFDSIRGLHNPPHEKFSSLRRSMLTHPAVETVPPTRPLEAVVSRRSILVTVEKESFLS